MSKPILYRVLITLGVLAILASGWAIGGAAVTLLGAAPSPRPSTVAVARPKEWVRLEDVALSCESRVFRNGTTFFLAAASSDGEPFVVQLLGDVACADAKVEGAFSPEHFPRETFEKNAGLTVPPELAKIRFFSEGYGPAYQKLVLTRMLPLLALGGLLVILGVRGARRSRPDLAPQVKTGRRPIRG
jgi:hypothetical protein